MSERNILTVPAAISEVIQVIDGSHLVVVSRRRRLRGDQLPLHTTASPPTLKPIHRQRGLLGQVAEVPGRKPELNVLIAVLLRDRPQVSDAQRGR